MNERDRTVDRIQCPVCYSSLRVPPRNELGKLAAVLQDVPMVRGHQTPVQVLPVVV